MDLCEPFAKTMSRFVAKIAERAESDHFDGVKKRPSGYELCEEYAEGWRKMHNRLASTIYNQVRASLETAERERAESGL